MSSLPAMPVSASGSPAFSPVQKEYLEGFMAGVAASGQFPFTGHTASGQLTASSADSATGNLSAPPPEDTVFGTPLSDLCKEERWKHDEDPLDAWERLIAHADANKFPDPENTYRFKTFGLFYVAPAQDSFMIRLRVPACQLSAHQLHGLADLASDLGGGYADLTTRGNLQIREFKPPALVQVLTRVQDLGLTSRGAGADNIRNVTASPNCGFDRDELLDVRPFALGVHHYILNHRDLYGLPRKFNVAFDNGGSLTAAADTNDIGFFATRVTEASLSKLPALDSQLSASVPAAGVYFRVQLGGISGHQDFARDTGLLIKPSEAVAVTAAMIRVFAEHGDRSNRKKSRLKYVLDAWGFEKFIAETQKKLAFPLGRLALEACEPRRPVIKHGWVGTYKQAQHGFNSIGFTVPAGRLKARQMHHLAELAQRHGQGELRLTVWQNIILPHIPDADVAEVVRQLHHLGFTTEANSLTSGIIACTGNQGCKYSSADTKAHALATSHHLASCDLALEQPVNLHFTGCAHSCAQHYCGDLGFISTKLPDGGEGYHVVIGGGMDQEQGIGKEIFRGVRATEVPSLVEKILRTYGVRRTSGETFVQWSRRHSIKELQEFFSV